MRLAEKRAVVTGAAGGIGRMTATFFAREGARVVLADLNGQTGRQAADQIRGEGGQADFVQTDVTQQQAVDNLVEQAVRLLGGIDVWMNNAGGTIGEELLESTPETWDTDLALNLTSHCLCCRAVLPVMIEAGGGNIINMSSVNALWSIGEFGYSAAKAGLIQFTKNLAVTYGSRGIRANVICPGTIDTPAGASYWDQRAGTKEKLIQWYPVGRLGRAEDVAHMAVYLASDESSFVSGATMVIDGGLTAGSRLFGT